MARLVTITQQQPSGRQPIPIPIQIDPANATPVYGTATPTQGVPKALRFLAYRYPSHDPRHWLILLLADRVAATGEITGEAMTPGDQRLVARHFSQLVRAHPVGTVATLVVPLLTVGGFVWIRRQMSCRQPSLLEYFVERLTSR